jgi:hypothetical protein
MVRPAIIDQQREDGTRRHEVAYLRPHHRAPGVGIPAGVATGGSRVASSGNGTPRCMAADAMAHDGSWTLRWCEHSTGGQLGDGNLPVRTRGLKQERIWGGGDGDEKRAPSTSDGDTVTAAGRLTRGDGLGSAPSWAGRGENGPR